MNLDLELQDLEYCGGEIFWSTFQPKQQNPARGRLARGEHKVAKVLVEGDDGPLLGLSPGEDLSILDGGGLFADPQDIVSLGPKSLDGSSRNVLVSQKPHHAADSGCMRSPATISAA